MGWRERRPWYRVQGLPGQHEGRTFVGSPTQVDQNLPVQMSLKRNTNLVEIDIDPLKLQVGGSMVTDILLESCYTKAPHSTSKHDKDITKTRRERFYLHTRAIKAMLTRDILPLNQSVNKNLYE